MVGVLFDCLCGVKWVIFVIVGFVKYDIVCMVVISGLCGVLVIDEIIV